MYKVKFKRYDFEDNKILEEDEILKSHLLDAYQYTHGCVRQCEDNRQWFMRVREVYATVDFIEICREDNTPVLLGDDDLEEFLKIYGSRLSFPRLPLSE